MTSQPLPVRRSPVVASIDILTTPWRGTVLVRGLARAALDVAFGFAVGWTISLMLGLSLGPGGQQALVPESIGVAVCVVVGWVAVWTALGAWRMARRDA